MAVDSPASPHSSSEELAQLREAERSSHERYLAVFEKSPFALALTRITDGAIVAVNDAFLRLFSFSREEVIGKSSVELGISDEASRNRVAEELRAHGEVHGLETTRRTKTGEERTLSLTIVRVRVGEAEHVLTTIEDITERKRTREALHLLAEASSTFTASHSIEESLLQVAQLALTTFADACSVYLKEDDGSVSQVITAGNRTEGQRAAYRAAALTPDAPFGYPKIIRTGQVEWVEHMTDAHVRAMASSEAHAQSIAALGVQSYIGVPLTRKATTIGAFFFVRNKPGAHYVAGDVMVAEELGKRASIALENALLLEEATALATAEADARRKAEEATRIKDEFLATLSHELRTPLHSILGWGRMLQSGRVAPERQEHAIATIVRNALVQNQLVDDLLDLSRIVSGMLRLDVEVLDFVPIVESALDVVHVAADAKGISLERSLAPDARYFSGDGGRIQLLVWNLVSNAVKFTPRGGHVQLKTRAVGEEIELSVADDGNGIAPEFLPFVFDRFRQQDSSIVRSFGGLGLGLAIVKSIAEMHGGTVEAHSPGVGLGATLIVRLPMALPAGGAVEFMTRESPRDQDDGTQPLKTNGCEGLRVLVVDDEEDARDLLRTVFEEAGAIVRAAEGAFEAMEMLDEEAFDVIVSDIGMPGEDGYTFMRNLRSRETSRGGKTPAIALTAYARPEDRERTLSAGFQDHAAKPVDLRELTRIALRVARKRLP